MTKDVDVTTDIIGQPVKFIALLANQWESLLLLSLKQTEM